MLYEYPCTNAIRANRIKAVFDLFFTHKEEVMANVAIDKGWGCSDHEIINFRIQRMSGNNNCRVRSVNLQTEFFREFLSGILWKGAMKEIGALAIWDDFIKKLTDSSGKNYSVKQKYWEFQFTCLCTEPLHEIISKKESYQKWK